MICENCNNLNCTNNDIVNKINKIDEKMNIILSVLGNLKIDSKSLECDVIDLKNKIEDKYDKTRKKTILNTNLREVKKEQYILDNDFVKDCLDSCSIDSDIKIFKKIYIDGLSKDSYSIRYKRKKIQYLFNGQMKDDDINYSYIKNTVIKNIEDCYLNINKYDSYQDNIEKFITNQEYINRMSENKYKDKFLEKIIELI
jgi:hypothetical protein